MFSLLEIFLIIGAHYFADFKFQTHWQAVNKSKSNIALGRHVLTYSLTFIPIALFLLGWWGLVWVILNGALHFITDYFTSRISSKKWAAQEWHDFFEIIGQDQTVHYFTLFSTYLLFK
jgi:hypothetical protein